MTEKFKEAYLNNKKKKNHLLSFSLDSFEKKVLLNGKLLLSSFPLKWFKNLLF
jgi:hypothetical protein